MDKVELINKLQQKQTLSDKERAYLIDVVNTSKKYGLVWEDKFERVEEELREKLPVLKEVHDHAIISGSDSPNHIIIEGDNLHALTALSFTHKGKVDVIYIDPPYNTGSKDFKYNDTYVDKTDVYRHSKWLSFMYKRLQIAFRLLKNDGFLVTSIDDNEVAQLKLILDGLSNENTKVVAVKMSEASGLKMGATNRAKNIPKYKEYIIYAKPSGVNNLHFDKIQKGEWDPEYNLYWDNFTLEDKNIINDIRYKDDILDSDIEIVDNILSKVRVRPLRTKLSELKLSTKREINDWLFANSWRILRTATSSSVKKLADEKRSKTKSNIFAVTSVRDKILYFVKANYDQSTKSPRVQYIFAEDNLVSHPGDFWSDIKTTGLEAEGGVEFKNGKKPLQLIERVIKSHSNKNAIILDFFAGSGTTLHATMLLNKKDDGARQCILVTNNENRICETITYERNRRAIEGYINPKGVEIEGLSQNNLRYYKADYVSNARTVANRRELTSRSTELLKIREDCYTDITEKSGFTHSECTITTNCNGRYMIAIYHSREMESTTLRLIDWIVSLEDCVDRVQVYGFSSDSQTLEAEFAPIKHIVNCEPLPDSIYNAYKATFKTIKINRNRAKV